MRTVTKETPKFKRISAIYNIFNRYKNRYPKGIQPTEDNIVDTGGIDLSKLSAEDQVYAVRGQLLNVNVCFIETREDLDNTLQYVKDFDTIAFDTETSDITLATQPRILLWSFSVTEGTSFVVPYHFNKEMLEYFTTTEQTVVCHNAGFDVKLVHHYSGGKFIKNIQDTMLILYCLLNDTRETPSLSLKENSKKRFGVWSDGSVKSKIGDLDESIVDDDEMIFYAGVDSISTLVLYNKHRKQIEDTESVPLDNILPIPHPSERTHSRYWFYKNVLLQMVPLTIDMMNNGLYLNMDKVHELDAKLDHILGEADTEVLNMPTVVAAWEEMRKEKSDKEVDRYKQTVDLNKVKIYKPTNNTYIDLFIKTLYPEVTKPAKAVNWSYTVVKTFDEVLARAIKDKNLESLRFVEKYADTFVTVEDTLTAMAIQSKKQKSEATAENKRSKYVLDYKFNPLASAAQKKYILQKGFGLSSNTKSITTGEDSFNKKELERLAKELQPDTEVAKYVKLLQTYSGGAIIKTNFVKNFKEKSIDGVIRGSYRLAGTKSARLASGGGGAVNMLNMPSSGSVFSKPVKQCITVPDDSWVYIGSDFTSLT
jgi:hypothetical protein